MMSGRYKPPQKEKENFLIDIESFWFCGGEKQQHAARFAVLCGGATNGFTTVSIAYILYC